MHYMSMRRARGYQNMALCWKKEKKRFFFFRAVPVTARAYYFVSHIFGFSLSWLDFSIVQVFLLPMPFPFPRDHTIPPARIYGFSLYHTELAYEIGYKLAYRATLLFRRAHFQIFTKLAYEINYQIHCIICRRFIRDKLVFGLVNYLVLRIFESLFCLMYPMFKRLNSP